MDMTPGWTTIQTTPSTRSESSLLRWTSAEGSYASWHSSAGSWRHCCCCCRRRRCSLAARVRLPQLLSWTHCQATGVKRSRDAAALQGHRTVRVRNIVDNIVLHWIFILKYLKQNSKLKLRHCWRYSFIWEYCKQYYIKTLFTIL